MPREFARRESMISCSLRLPEVDGITSVLDSRRPLELIPLLLEDLEVQAIT